MNGRANKEGKWTEVRRRGKPEEITTFFVSKIPPGIGRDAILKEFSRYGKVTNVYVASKKDSQGHFAFVRFKGVNNEKSMEERLRYVAINGMNRLVHVARYARKIGAQNFREVPKNGMQYERVNQVNERIQCIDSRFNPTIGGSRRSFADVVGEVEDRLQSAQKSDGRMQNRGGRSMHLGRQNAYLGGMEQTTREKNQNGPDGGNWVGQEPNGLLTDLVPLGCFGPFPANFDNMGSSRNSRKGRKSKRRRADTEGRSCSPMVQTSHTPANNCRSDSIDLNANPATSDHGAALEPSAEDGIEVSASPVVDEIRETVAIGNEIGFQIEEGNLLLSKEVGGDGVQINNQ
ncbi:hypothetical protein L2E82_39116 [Cichorium intybus]|uniref:Uncharacterized protein n=1 Tax=Cichorium intybus TaxID=13427 RepID=A0ACB9AHB6_CICIN|nr:hypothetical protein L2E82_39116 [Cichorium intybus]